MPSFLPFYGTDAVPIETFEVGLEVAQARMTALINSESALATLSHQEIVAYAMPIDLVQQVIADKNVDLVVVGSHGASGIERLVLGSVADSILHTIRCPVLVIGPRATPQDNLFRSVLLAASLTTAGLRSAQYASVLAEHFHSKLTLLHVVEPKSRPPVQPELLEDHLIAKLQDLVPDDLPVHATVIPQVEYGNAGDVIVSFALCKRSSLIVTGAHEEKTFSDRTPWSTLAEVIRRTPCPVLCVMVDFG